MRARVLGLAALAMSGLSYVTVAQQPPATVPSADTIIDRACQAAGGWDTFVKNGIIRLQISQEENTQDGKVQKSESAYFVALPGPVPARLELPDRQTIAGDDGNGGWALIGGVPDSRPNTQMMVRRLIQSNAFTHLLPFSLRWVGATVTTIQPAQVKGRSVWRLTVDFGRNFFSSPQIASKWKIDIDSQTYEVVGAESPATDLGKGIKADGMRFSWAKPVKVGGVTLAGFENVLGVDEKGAEKAHSRIRNVSFQLLPNSKAPALFANPIPPDKRPKPPQARVPPPNLPPAK